MPDILYYFHRACQRNLEQTPRGTCGERVVDADGNFAHFSISTDGDLITGAHFRCTTCFTLVALCEHLSELLAGMSLDAALRLTAADLLHCHPEIPHMRQDRAELAIEAAHSALVKLGVCI